MVEFVDRPHLLAQRGVDLVIATFGRAGREVRAHQQVQAVALQGEAHPAEMLFAGEILKRKRTPEIPAGDDGPAQRRDHRLDLGEIVVGRRGARVEGEGLRDLHTLLGGLLGQHVGALSRIRVADDQNRLCDVDSPHCIPRP